MRSEGSERAAAPAWAPAIDGLVGLGAAWMLAMLFAVWASRWSHPWDLEWMEGGMLAHGWRLQQGLPLYSEPTAEWVPYVYPPGYSAMLAASGSALDFWVGRALSIVGSLLAASALVVGVGRHGRSWTLGLLSGATFLLSYASSGAFMDMVRPDAMAVGLAGWAIVLTVDGRRGTDVAGGLLLAAAFLVKHNLAGFGVPLALGLWAWRGWRTALRFGLAAALPALALTGYLQWRSDGGFLTYLLEVPGSHPMMWRRGVPGTPMEAGHWLGPLLAVVGLAFAVTAPRRGSGVHPAVVWAGGGILGLAAAIWAYGEEPVVGVVGATSHAPTNVLTYFALGAAMGSGLVALLAGAVERRMDGPWWTAAGLFWMGCLLAVLMRAHNGGFVNVLMPWHWMICGLAGVLLGRLRTTLASAKLRAVGSVFGSLVFALQLGVLYQLTNLDRLTPTNDDLEAGEALIAALESCDGPIFSPFAAWLPTRLDKAPSPHLIAIWDIDHRGGPLHEHMDVFTRATRDHAYACVVDAGRKPLGYGVQKHYQRVFRLLGRGLAAKTGWRVRPHSIYEPKEVR